MSEEIPDTDLDPTEPESAADILPEPEPPTFPTFHAGPHKRFRVSCQGYPALEGDAIDESEAIRAYRIATGIDDKQGNHGARVPAFKVEPL